MSSFVLRLIILSLVGLLAMRGSIADGYMVDRSNEDGSLIIRMCSGVDERLMRLNMSTGELTELSEQGDETTDLPANLAFVCDFAAVQLTPPPTFLAVTEPALYAERRVIWFALKTIISSAELAFRPPPTGPPTASVFLIT